MAPKEDIPDEPKRAMIDLGATHKQSSAWDSEWTKLMLTDKAGFYPSKGQRFQPMWLEVDMPGNEFYEVSSVTMMKGGAGKQSFIKAFQLQFSYDEGKNWHTHSDGKWFETGLTAYDELKTL